MTVMVLEIIMSEQGTVFKVLERKLEEQEIRGRIEAIQTKSIVKVSVNTEMGPAVTRIPSKDHQLPI